MKSLGLLVAVALLSGCASAPPSISIDHASNGHWCGAMDVLFNAAVEGSDGTVSLCRVPRVDGVPPTLISLYGVIGQHPEPVLEYVGFVRDTLRVGAVLWGEGVETLADLASAMANPDSTWHYASAALSSQDYAEAATLDDTDGFYMIEAMTGLVSQTVYVYRTNGGLEYALIKASERWEDDSSPDGPYLSVTVTDP